MMYLRQSTASQTVVIGPFVDSTDGVTAETALTIANTDIRLSKNGGNIVAKNSGGGTHDEIGYYTITLDATDTNTVGMLQLMVAESGALPVYHEFIVLEEAVYDAMFASSAVGPLLASTTGSGLTAIPWNAAWDAEVQSEATDALNAYDPPTNAEMVARTLVAASYATATALQTVDDEIATIDANVDAILVDTSTTLQAELDGIQADTEDIQSKLGTPTDFGSGASTIAANLQDLADNGTATYDRSTDSLQAIRDRGDAAWTTGAGGSAPTASEIADAVWDEAKSGHTTAGSFGEEVQAHALSTEVSALNDLDAAGVRSAVGLASANLDTQLATIDGNVDSILVDTGTSIPGDIAALNDLDAAGVRSAVGLASANLDTQLADIPTVAEFQARTLAAADYFDHTTDTADANIVAVNGDTTTAAKLEALLDGIFVGQVNDASATTTSFIADGFTEATNDHFNGRLITFLTGALAGQQTAITDYVGATQTFTVTALTEAPANDVFFVIH